MYTLSWVHSERETLDAQQYLHKWQLQSHLSCNQAEFQGITCNTYY